MVSNRFRKAALPAALISLGLAFSATGQGSSQLSPGDRTFVEKAAKQTV